jgi:RNA polymerase sigma factor (sigma-70 family)
VNQDSWQSGLVAESRATQRRAEAAAYRLARDVPRPDPDDDPGPLIARATPVRTDRAPEPAGRGVSRSAWAEDGAKRSDRAEDPAGRGGPGVRPDGGDERVAALLGAARAGDQRAWRSLVELHAVLLAHVARSCGLGPADTADAVQLTWLKLVENLDRIREPARLRAWLVTTCRREALRLARSSPRLSPEDLRELAGPEVVPDPAEVAVRNDAARILHSAVDRLPGRQRRLLVELLRGDDAAEAYAAVAERLEMPLGSVGPTRQRALRRLSTDHGIRSLHPTPA